MFEASPLPVVSFDAEHRVLLWNGAAERTFGWPAVEVLGGRSPIVPPDEMGTIRIMAA